MTDLKYKLFYGDNYYPLGGYDDFKGNFDSIEEAIKYLKVAEPCASYMWAHIVLDDKIVFHSENNDDFMNKNWIMVNNL